MLSDMEFAMEIVRHNVAANFVTDGPAVAALEWGDLNAAASLRRSHGPFDLVVGAEVTYDSDLHAALLDTIAAVLSPTGEALLAVRV